MATLECRKIDMLLRIKNEITNLGESMDILAKKVKWETLDCKNYNVILNFPRFNSLFRDKDSFFRAGTPGHPGALGSKF